MPAKGKQKLSRTAEHRVIKKRVAGQTVRAVAADEGIAPSTVSAVAKRNSALIARLTDEYEIDLCRMYGKALKKLDRDLGSKSARTRHDARVALLKYVTAASRLQAQAATPGDVSLAEVLVVYGRLVGK